MLFLFSLLLPLKSFAYDWDQVPELKKSQCVSEFKDYLKLNQLTNLNYQMRFGDYYNQKRFSASTGEIGKWLQIDIREKHSPEIVFTEGSVLHRLSYDKDCRPKYNEESLPNNLKDIFQAKSENDLTDQKLSSIISSGKKGIFYNWSPKFTYSVKDINRIAKLMKKNGYEFYPLLDPRVSLDEAKNSLNALQTQNFKWNRTIATEVNPVRNISMDLFMRNNFTHFPVVYVFNNKQIHSRHITGIMKDKDLIKMLNEYTGELK